MLLCHSELSGPIVHLGGVLREAERAVCACRVEVVHSELAVCHLVRMALDLVVLHRRHSVGLLLVRLLVRHHISLFEVTAHVLGLTDHVGLLLGLEVQERGLVDALGVRVSHADLVHLPRVHSVHLEVGVVA